MPTASGQKQPPRDVAVTGTSGYVGSRIASALERRGHRVRRLQRSGDGAGIHRFSLPHAPAAEALAGADALVHCAYDFSATTWPEIVRANVEGTARLFQAARAAHVRTLIFISSMSAFDGCRSMYGRAKLEAEQRVRELGGIVVRPGLVYGSASGGMVAALSKLLGIPLMTPLVGRGDQVLYLVHEDDLGAMIADLCETPGERLEPIIAANSRPFTLRDILALLAQQRGVRRAFVPVPWRLEWGALRAAEALGLRIRLRSDSLVSLLNQDRAPNFAPSAMFTFRDFASSAAPPS
jgi:nucleoside-diphosphate-sugar epimerase